MRPGGGRRAGLPTAPGSPGPRRCGRRNPTGRGRRLRAACGVRRGSGAPVQHLVAFGDDGEIALRIGHRPVLQGAQFVDEGRCEEKALFGRVPGSLLADVLGQVARRVHRRIEQHRRAAGGLGHMGGIEAAQRGADHAHRVLRPAGDALQHQLGGRPWRGRQLGAPPDHLGMALRHPRGHLAGLGRLGRGAEAVQVKKVGDGRAGSHGPRCYRR